MQNQGKSRGYMFDRWLLPHIYILVVVVVSSSGGGGGVFKTKKIYFLKPLECRCGILLRDRSGKLPKKRNARVPRRQAL